MKKGGPIGPPFALRWTKYALSPLFIFTSFLGVAGFTSGLGFLHFVLRLQDLNENHTFHLAEIQSDCPYRVHRLDAHWSFRLRLQEHLQEGNLASLGTSKLVGLQVGSSLFERSKGEYSVVRVLEVGRLEVGCRFAVTGARQHNLRLVLLCFLRLQLHRRFFVASREGSRI